jgi:hypothetical protein
MEKRMPEHFQDVLDECIDRVLQGESVDECLRRHPQQAAELEPLLRVALATKRASSVVEPRAEFKDRTRYEVQSRVAAKWRGTSPKKAPAAVWIPRWAVVTACLALVLVLAGTGTVAAASGSVPGDKLYSVKMATEQVQWKLTFSQKAKAKLQARFAERRVQEIAQLAKKGRTEELEKLTSRFEAHLAKIEQLAEQIRATDSEDGERITELRQVLYVNMARDLAILEVAEARAPERAQAAIAVARARLMERYGEAIKALDELQGGQVGLTRATGGSGTRYQSLMAGRSGDLYSGII